MNADRVSAGLTAQSLFTDNTVF
jgi:hypothetical protein